METFIVGVVGPCGSGKTTLVKGLRGLGYIARHIAQEHSYVPDMWKRISRPDVLVYLDASYESTVLRRNLNWTRDEFEEQLRRLRHAKKHSNIYIRTDDLSIDQVITKVVHSLRQQGRDNPINHFE